MNGTENSHLLGVHNTIKGFLEPGNSVLFSKAVMNTDWLLGVFAASNTSARATKDNVEVHTMNTHGRIVFDAKIDVFLNTKAKVSVVRKVALLQFIFLHFKAAFQKLVRFRSSDGAVDGDFFVTTDGEGTDCVASLRIDGCLTGQLFQNFGSASQTIARLTGTDIETELLNVDFPHGIGSFFVFNSGLKNRK